jgi:hypothetical protein
LPCHGHAHLACKMCTYDGNDSLGEHGEDWDAWDWHRYADGIGCPIKSPRAQTTSVRVSDDDMEGSMRTSLDDEGT